MKDFASKLSLYDILSMLIPGSTIFIFLSLALENELQLYPFKINTAIGWIIVLVSSYLIGLINHVFTAIIWHPLRNRHTMIEKELLNITDTGNTRYLSKFLSKISINNIKREERIYIRFIILGYCVPTLATLFLGLTYCKYKLTSLPLIVYIIILAIIVIVQYFYRRKKCDIKNTLSIDAYYEAYYYVSKHKMGNEISIIEGQVAFMQNMFLPLSLMLVLPLSTYEYYICNAYIIKILISVGICLLLPTIYYRQNKIYEHVWEDYEYLKRIEEEDKPKEQ